MYVVDRIRLDDFRQLKKEIRGSKGHLIVGIDVDSMHYRVVLYPFAEEPGPARYTPVYRPRKPQESQYYQCVEDNFEELEQVYDDRFATK